MINVSSSLSANILLDDLDKELEKRGHHFVRYADDFIISVKSLSAAERVMTSISRFLKRELRLIVNEKKSSFGRMDEWLRRRIRKCFWKQWRYTRTKVFNLFKLGTFKR